MGLENIMTFAITIWFGISAEILDEDFDQLGHLL